MTNPDSTTGRARQMSLVGALAALHAVRGDQVVISTMGAAREWPKLSAHPLDLHYIPSAMGHAPALGLGMALAQPGREIIVLNGDGCQLMSLGVLVTIAASGATNLTLVVLDNGRYEVTGGQATAAAAAPRERRADFAGLARAAGWPTVQAFDDEVTLQRDLPVSLRLPGPRFLHWVVAPVADYLLDSPGPMGPRLMAFCEALATPGAAIS